jgi:hypothetical protein
MRQISLAFFSVLLCLPCVALSQDATANQGEHPVEPPRLDATATLRGIVNQQLAWESNKVSTGATLQLKEIARQRHSDRTLVTYRIVASGFSPDGVYTLMQWGLDNQIHQLLTGVTFMKDGTAVCSGTKPGSCGDPAKPDDPIDLPFFGAKGEAVRLALASPGGKPLATVSAEPFPISAEEKGCNLSAILLFPNAEAILIEGAGFASGTTVSFTGDSSGEKHDSTHEVDAKGNFRFVVLPNKAGVDHGTITLQPTTGSCRPSMTMPWGKDSYKLQ